MRFNVDWSLCDGNGLCAIEAPELLKLNEDDELIVLKEDFGDEYQIQADRAVQVCPKCALSLNDS